MAHNIPRRKALKAALLSVGALASGASHSALKANSTAGNSTDNDMDLANLINTLRAMEKGVCDTAAENIERSMSSGASIYLHLRNAGLDLSDVQHLGEALKALSNSNTKQISSFSVSYNDQLGDAGALALAQSLPHTLQEIGLVACNIHDEGGAALLQWAKQASSLKMICIEGNKFSKETRSRFSLLRQESPELAVFI